jgi:hypothetical protein
VDEKGCSVAEIERQAEWLNLQAYDRLLDQITEKDRASILMVARLMDMRASLNINVRECPFDCDLPAVTKTDLSRPGVKAHLANLQANQELQILSCRKRMHLLILRQAMTRRNGAFLRVADLLSIWFL